MTKRLLCELLKNSKRSDAELAKVMGISQPTVTRMRNSLLKEGVIQEFTVIPDFAKMGFKVMAVTIAKAKPVLTTEEQITAQKLLLKNPQVIFATSAEGMGRTGIMISVHESYSDYQVFLRDLKGKSGGYLEQADSMLVNLESEAANLLSLANLAKNETLQELNACHQNQSPELKHALA